MGLLRHEVHTSFLYYIYIIYKGLFRGEFSTDNLMYNIINQWDYISMNSIPFDTNVCRPMSS